MSNTYYIGIDPGMEGALAVIDPDGKAHIEDAPVTKVAKGRDYMVGSMRNALEFAAAGQQCVAILEAGIAMPRQSSTSTYKTGRGGGLWEGLLAGLNIPYELVAPAKWKKAMGVTGDKGEAIALAQRLFPQCADRLIKSKDGRAEALLLAEYRRRLG